MVVRGLIGFRCAGIEKLTYNGLDSHPEYLGQRILRELKKVRDWGVVYKHAGTVVLVDQWRQLTDQSGEIEVRKLQQEFPRLRYRGHPQNYFQLLKPFQGSLRPYLEANLSIMADSHDFFTERFLCEWIYIVDLDSLELEIWNGRQRTSHLAESQEKAGLEPDRFGYYPTARLKAYSLLSLPCSSRVYEDLRRPPRYPTR